MYSRRRTPPCTNQFGFCFVELLVVIGTIGQMVKDGWIRNSFGFDWVGVEVIGFRT
jgi:hypothetical protein